MKYKLSGKMIRKFLALRPKIYSYLTSDNEETKQISKKMCFKKLKLKFEDYKHFLESAQLENKIDQFKKIQLMCIVLKKITKQQ